MYTCTHRQTYTHRQTQIYIPHPYCQSGHGWLIYCIVHHLNVISASAMRVIFIFFFKGIFVTVIRVSEDAVLYASIINGGHTSPALFYLRGLLWIFISLLTPLKQTTVFTVSISHGEEGIMECVHLCMCVFADTALWLANLHAGGGVLKYPVAVIGCFSPPNRGAAISLV